MATTGHSGYPLKWFKDQNGARRAYECAICLEVLKDPVQVRDCGHQFCALCIDDILKTDPRCPSCRIELSDVKIFEDHAARRLINQLDVNCCNEGCSWVGCLSSLREDHQNSCNFLIRSGDNINQLDVGKLEQKLESLMLKVSTLEKKHEQDIKELKLKHEQDNEELKLKYEQDIKEFKLKHENELKEVKSKHDGDVKLLRQEILFSRTMGAAADVPKTSSQQSSLNKEPEPAYTWKIANFTRKLAQAKSSNDLGVLESQPFFSSHGYRMKLLVYLNQLSSGKSGFMGAYLCLLRGDKDGSLTWPFTKRYALVLLDQQDDPSQSKNIKKEVVPKGQPEFQRRRGWHSENLGYGFAKFVEHSILNTRNYIRDHNVYIEVIVDP